eukprot:2875740-Prymnesium_polylepis.1
MASMRGGINYKATSHVHAVPSGPSLTRHAPPPVLRHPPADRSGRRGLPRRRGGMRAAIHVHDHVAHS